MVDIDSALFIPVGVVPVFQFDLLTFIHSLAHFMKFHSLNLKTSNPSQKNLALLAQYFDCTVDYLLGNSDDRETVTIPIQESIQLSEEERILISAFRSASIEGRMRIIQVCMNEKDSKGETIIAG